MCRFLLVKAKNKVKLDKFLQDFASMCKKSQSPDGDWQGDGWGIAMKNKTWEVYKSLNPIWEETDNFGQLKGTEMFVVHARSAGFADQKGIIEYNQPYVTNSLCFVFNGMVRGVKIPINLEGKIGSQKIFSLLQKFFSSKSNNPAGIENTRKKLPEMEQALRKIDTLILNSSRKIEGLNIGVVFEGKFYVLCEYENNQDYFGIRYYQDDNLTLVSSSPFSSFRWRIMGKSEILVI